MKPEILAEVSFLPTANGGRQGNTPADRFGCLVEYQGEFFDCRLDLAATGPIAPGSIVTVPIQFLAPHLIVPRLSPGARFTLWDGRTVATGSVVSVLTAA